MHIIPTQEEVVAVLRETGALRNGHFEYPSGLHSNEYLQVPLAMRYYQHQRMLSVGLSRLLRANPEIRAIVRELSIVVPMTGGLPVAYGVTEALDRKSTRLNSSHSLHDALPIWVEPAAARQPGNPRHCAGAFHCGPDDRRTAGGVRRHRSPRSEEHTSELQSLPTRRSSDLG